MGVQRHVIKKLVIEITLAKKDDAWPLQQMLSGFFRLHAPALLDRCLSEASGPDGIQRIDHLELDLGELDGSCLEAQLPKKIDAALRRALRGQLGPTPSAPEFKQPIDPMQAHWELLEHFVREGNLPWWADKGQRRMPEKSFMALLSGDANGLRDLLSGFIQEPRFLQRLIGHFDDGHLVAMTVLLSLATKDLATSLWQTLSAVQEPLHRHSRMPAQRLRATLWQSILQVANANAPPISRHADFLSAVTVRWAKLQGLPHEVLVGYLLVGLAGVNNVWVQAISPSARLAEKAISNRYALLKKADVVCPLVGQGEFKVQALPARKPGSGLSVLKDGHEITSTFAPSPVEEGWEHENEDFQRLLGQTNDASYKWLFYRHRFAPVTISNRYPMLKKFFVTNSKLAKKTMEKSFDESAMPGHPFNAGPQKKTSARKNSNLPFGDSDALYIDNAGLCILWPFLNPFFERLELVQNGRFHDQASRHCAVNILHYLATEELSPPEYFLPFNKVLCGMAHDDSAEFDVPLTALQTQACDELLGDVIVRVPILNNMSVNGFRGSYLLRQGCLGAKDGSWLLHVERKVYDVVLERFPWSWQRFKLPWMDYPVRVEW